MDGHIRSVIFTLLLILTATAKVVVRYELLVLWDGVGEGERGNDIVIF